MRAFKRKTTAKKPDAWGKTSMKIIDLGACRTAMKQSCGPQPLLERISRCTYPVTVSPRPLIACRIIPAVCPSALWEMPRPTVSANAGLLKPRRN